MIYGGKLPTIHLNLKTIHNSNQHQFLQQKTSTQNIFQQKSLILLKHFFTE